MYTILYRHVSQYLAAIQAISATTHSDDARRKSGGRASWRAETIEKTITTVQRNERPDGAG